MHGPHNIRLPHEQLLGARGRAKHGRITIAHKLQGSAFKQEVSVIMCIMQGALLAQATVLWDTRMPAQDNMQ